MADRYGVAPEMLVAIVGVETFFGQRMGRYRVLDALATLAFAYPPRAEFFASELESFLLLAREENVDTPLRAAHTPARWVRVSSSRRAIVPTPSTATTTASAIFGPIGTTRSAA